MSVPESRPSTHRAFIGVLVGVGLLIALSFPFALGYDDDLDVQRTGYNDAATVARLQKVLTDKDKAPVPFEVRSGDSVQIGRESFTPAAGNSVVSEVNEQGICVRVSNENPEIRAWEYDSADGEHPYDGIADGACG